MRGSIAPSGGGLHRVHGHEVGDPLRERRDGLGALEQVRRAGPERNALTAAGSGEITDSASRRDR